MAPTFPLFLGLIVYLGLIIVTLLVFIPMLLLDSKKVFAKKVIATVVISFPCLIVMVILWVIIFIIPSLLFHWIANSDIIPRIPGIIFAIIVTLVFVGLIVLSSLYLWYLTSKIIYQRLDKKPIADFLDNDKVFKILKPYLIRLKLCHPVS